LRWLFFAIISPHLPTIRLPKSLIGSVGHQPPRPRANTTLRRGPDRTLFKLPTAPRLACRASMTRTGQEFSERFSGATVVKLERNYRSTPAILEATNAVIALSPQRHFSSRRGSKSRCLERPSALAGRPEQACPTARLV